jgi:hypothetical protein
VEEALGLARNIGFAGVDCEGQGLAGRIEFVSGDEKHCEIQGRGCCRAGWTILYGFVEHL